MKILENINNFVSLCTKKLGDTSCAIITGAKKSFRNLSNLRSHVSHFFKSIFSRKSEDFTKIKTKKSKRDDFNIIETKKNFSYEVLEKNEIGCGPNKKKTNKKNKEVWDYQKKEEEYDKYIFENKKVDNSEPEKDILKYFDKKNEESFDSIIEHEEEKIIEQEIKNKEKEKKLIEQKIKNKEKEQIVEQKVEQKKEQIVEQKIEQKKEQIVEQKIENKENKIEEKKTELKELLQGDVQLLLGIDKIKKFDDEIEKATSSKSLEKIEKNIKNATK